MKDSNTTKRDAPCRSSIARLCALYLWAAVGLTSATHAQGAQMKGKSPSRQTAQLLIILEAKDNPIEERIAAVRELGKVQEAASVESLCDLLPGEYDALSYEVILALKVLKHPKAITKLQQILDDDSTDVPGKLRAAAKEAILACGGTLQSKP